MHLLLAFLLLFPLPALAGWSDMNDQINRTNFKVNDGCSGTLIQADPPVILTAAHCVSAQYETVEREVVSEEGIVTKEKVRKLKPGTVTQKQFFDSSEVYSAVYRTRLIAVSGEHDLALLGIMAVPWPLVSPSRLACKSPVRGDPIYIVGNPMGDLYGSVVPGFVSSTDRTYGMIGFPGREDEPLMQVSGGIVGGNSGGSVYNADGQLVGVPVIGHRTNEVLGFAVPLDVIKGFLKDNKLGGVFSYCEVVP